MASRDDGLLSYQEAIAIIEAALVQEQRRMTAAKMALELVAASAVAEMAEMAALSNGDGESVSG